jgi:hypothetical protein
MHRFTIPASDEAGRRFGRVVRASTLLLATLVALAPVAAQANDLSDSPCTAGDVEIVGSGIVVNEPCTCPPGGTFSANVQFIVRNNTSTSRYCIALHRPTVSCFTQPLDVVLHDANGNSTATGKSGSEKFHDAMRSARLELRVTLARFGWTLASRRGARRHVHDDRLYEPRARLVGRGPAPPGGRAGTGRCGVGLRRRSTARRRPRAAVLTPRPAWLGPVTGPFTLTVTGASPRAFRACWGSVRHDVPHPPGAPPMPDDTHTLTITDKNGCTRTDTATSP